MSSSSHNHNSRRKNSSSRNRSRRRGNYNEFNDEESLFGNGRSRNNNISFSGAEMMENCNGDGDNDSIPHFANFDNLSANVDMNGGGQGRDSGSEHISIRKKKKKSSRNSNTSNSPRKTNGFPVSSSSSSISYVDRNNQNMTMNINVDMDMNRMNLQVPKRVATKKTSNRSNDSVVGMYDSKAATDYKWAKLQATSELTKTISPIKIKKRFQSAGAIVGAIAGVSPSKATIHNDHPSIRQPINAGFVRRSISAGGKIRNSPTNDTSIHTDNHRSKSDRRRDRSVNPDDPKMQHHQNPAHLNPIKTRARSRSPAPHTMTNGKKASRPTISSMKPNIIQQRQQQPKKQPQTKEERKLRKYYENKQHTFQNPFHELVSYKVHDLKGRIAFEKAKPITFADLEVVASKEPLEDDDINSSTESRLEQLSPSPQYVEILDTMNKISSARQLCWSPSVSREADPFFGWGEMDEEEVLSNNNDDDDENDASDAVKDDSYNNNEMEGAKDTTAAQGRSTIERDRRKKILLKRKRRQVSASKFGLRCNQIDPAEYASKTLLDHAPLLTNIRKRLPMRSDVGFPKATEEEINLKQSEIAKEAQLEEVSPRLIVLLRSDDIGSPPDMGVNKILDTNSCHDRLLKYSLPGIPFAGKELMTLKQTQNRSSVVLRDHSAIQTTAECSKVQPDPCSMFAPPTDSIISSSEMWRSRPFSDRPAGISYGIAIPVDVRFSAGKIEPLICTLALYCLPRESTPEAMKYKGKISEDHIFPAGDWSGLLEEKAGEILARQFGMMEESAKEVNGKKQRAKKALFSFDPTALPKNEQHGLDSLFLVMNVHKVTHRDAGITYMNHSYGKNSISSTKRTLSGLFFGSSNSTSSSSSRHNVSNAKMRATNAFNSSGSQFLTPFCFGILPFFPHDPEIQSNGNDELMWPNGITQSMIMFSQPIKPESHDAFVDRILSIAERTNLHSQIVDEVTNSLSSVDNISFDDDSNIIAISSEDSMNSRSTGPKRRRLKFKFRKRKTQKRQLVDMADVLNDETYLIDGTAIFYTSKVGVDFSQTLLQQPSFLAREDIKDQSLPRLLVDVSGDCAIMVNPEHDNSSRKRRSNLIRLPPSTKPSGYSDSCEIREILYLPLQNEMKYEPPPCFSPRTSLNLFYLYPRLIRKVSSEQENGRNMCYSVRIQLVQRCFKIDEDTGAMSSMYVPSESIYNPAPGGESLLKSVYTKIPFGATGKHSKADIHTGIALQDEIKIRLPTILDGSHYLQFSLYSILLKTEDKSNGGVIQNYIGDNYVALSSNSTKKSMFGKSVPIHTVIPNGSYWIEIGCFQVQIVTRLVSTIHISDPAVASVVRDFTILGDKINAKRLESPSDFNQLSRNMLSKSSEQSVYLNFYTLAFIHLRAFVKIGRLELEVRSKNLSVSNDIIFKMEILRSLFRVMDKAKKRFLQVENECGIKRFIKTFLDIFDEQYFNKNRQMYTVTTSSQSTSNISLESDLDIEIVKDYPSSKAEDQYINDVYGKVKKQNVENYIDKKMLHVRYANNAVPFSRTAYRVSKIDRMKAEAELYEEGQMLNELYDDDETVVTASTWHSHPHLASSTNSSSTKRPGTAQSVIKVPTRTQLPEKPHSDAATIISTSDHEEFFTPLERARSMANRVNLVAQIFTAPCTAPDIETTIQSPDRRKLSRIRKIRTPIQKKAKGLLEEYQQAQAKKKQDQQTNKIYMSGSDIEDDLETNSTKKQHFSPYPDSPMGVRLRGNYNRFDELSFSISVKSESIQDDSKNASIYELIWIVWLHFSRQEIDEDEDPGLFMNNIDFLLPLCLKSLALRCLTRKRVPEVVPSTLLDMNHMIVLVPLIETIAKGFVDQVVKTHNTVDLAIADVLDKSNIVVDFLIGLLALIHPSQVYWLILRYLEALRLCEEGQEVSVETASRALSVIRVNRLLRLRAAEKLSSMPRFVALNFPYKFQSYRWEKSNVSCSWINQVMEKEQINNTSAPPDGCERLPETNWLAEILTNECFAICSQSCETIVNKTISQVQNKTSSKKKSAIRQRITIPEEDMTHYHSIGYHSVCIVYDLVLRLHATDCRYQSEEAKSRIAGIFVSSVIENSLQAVQWLSKISAGSKIRSVWLLCILYVLQEAPETALRRQIYAMCTVKSHMKESRLGRFIRILKLCTTTFQSFTDTKYLPQIAPWLLQESFNTISASSILLVDECYEILSQNPYEQSKMVEGTLDLLLQIISAPLSSVTLLRALGAASQVLDKIGTSLFLVAVEDDLQHWGRMIFSLMNSTSLSVRSMAVDLTVSMFGSLFKEDGNIDEVAQIFLTVLPEVVAREIALYSINGLITSVSSVESSLWPLRRALADVEEADPFDDDRVDAQLSPFLGQFCRACQAVIDGVLIELRLKGNDCEIVGTKVMMLRGKVRSSDENALPISWAFDADEESLFEAASSFVPETSPLQRIRWLLTLKRLHETKGQWVEAGETLILCAKTVAEAIPHVRNLWRPSQFPLWIDLSVAPWLATIGEKAHQSKVNKHLMTFAHDFLEPSELRNLITTTGDSNAQPSLAQPNIPSLCEILTNVSKESVEMYNKENGMDPLTFARLEELLKIVMGFVEEHAMSTIRGTGRKSVRQYRTQSVEEITMLRKVSTTLNELVTKIAERMLSVAKGTPNSLGINFPYTPTAFSLNFQNKTSKMELFFVRVELMGKKCDRFLESTTIPTFLDWNIPHICRVPSESVSKAMNGEKIKYAKKNMKPGPSLQEFIENEICIIFAEPYIALLEDELSQGNVKFYTEFPDEREIEKDKTVLHFIVSPVRAIRSTKDQSYQSKKFHCRATEEGTKEITLANQFPCALSRQATLITRMLHEATIPHHK